MDVFCKLGDNSSDFCKAGNGEKAEKAAIAGTADEIKRFWEVGDVSEAGTTGFCEVGNAEGYGKKPFCDVNAEKLVSDASSVENAATDAFDYSFRILGDVETQEWVSGAENAATDSFGYSFYKLGDVEAQDWVSPRISFSQDFVMPDPNSLYNSNPSRVSPDRKKGEQDNYSAEFEFLKDGPDYGPRDQAKGFMLPADELFFDGKLLPLPFPSIWAASDDLGLSLSCDQHRQEAEFCRQTSHNRPIARHLSFDIAKPSSSLSSISSVSYISLHSTCGCISAPSKDSQLDSSNTNPDALSPSSSSSSPSPSPSPSPSSSSLLPSSATISASSVAMAVALSSSSTASASPSLVSSSISSTTSTSSLSSSSSVTKCSTKLKDLFKSKRFTKASSSWQLTRDSSPTSTCRLPISSRTFWPFARSHSAGESKSTPPLPIPCRSNSAGERHTCSVSCPKELDAIEGARLSSSSSVGHSKDQDPITTVLEDNPYTTTQSMILPLEDVARVEENADVCNRTTGTNIDSAEIMNVSQNARSSGSQRFLKVTGKKVAGTSGRGSPGRRRGASSSSGVKANGGKMVLRNLERCSAEKKLGRDGWRGLNRRGSFPVGARVSPVLNVAVYRGSNTPKIGLFGFNSLLSPKKEKSMEVSINWRNGA